MFTGMAVSYGLWSGRSMYHPKTREWDKKLKSACDRIDRWLEDEYGSCYRLRPNRAPRGATSNPEMDGLFNVQTVFTPGYGSEKGRGYLVEIELSTLETVDPGVMEEIRTVVIRMMEKELEREFPERKLAIGFDGNMIKIWGDLNLGSI